MRASLASAAALAAFAAAAASVGRCLRCLLVAFELGPSGKKVKLAPPSFRERGRPLSLPPLCPRPCQRTQSAGKGTASLTCRIRELTGFCPLTFPVDGISDRTPDSDPVSIRPDRPSRSLRLCGRWGSDAHRGRVHVRRTGPRHAAVRYARPVAHFMDTCLTRVAKPKKRLRTLSAPSRLSPRAG
jgi:hypothetical protein